MNAQRLCKVHTKHTKIAFNMHTNIPFNGNQVHFSKNVFIQE